MQARGFIEYILLCIVDATIKIMLNLMITVEEELKYAMNGAENMDSSTFISGRQKMDIETI